MEEGSLSWRSMPLLECQSLHSWLASLLYSLSCIVTDSSRNINTLSDWTSFHLCWWKQNSWTHLAKRITPSWLSDLRGVSALCGVKFRNFEIYSLTWQKHIKELQNLMLQKKKTYHSLVKNIIFHDSFYLVCNCCTVKVRNTEFYWIFVHFLMFFMFWKIKVCFVLFCFYNELRYYLRHTSSFFVHTVSFTI